MPQPFLNDNKNDKRKEKNMDTVTSFSQEQIQLYNNLAQYTVIMQNGDKAAYDQIYNIMFPHVNALIRARGIDDHDVADIAQETMISVYKGIDTIKDPQSTYKWVISLANNKITDFYRRSHTRSAHEVHIMSEDDDLGEQERIYQNSHDMQAGQLSLTVPEDIYVNKERQQLLLEIVKGLKEDEQQIIMMKCFSDITFKDIAETIGCSESTVKTKFYRSLNKLESAIYDTEKKEGIRLHSVGLIPFILFLFIQYTKTVPVNPNVQAQVKDNLIKKISSNTGTEGASELSNVNTLAANSATAGKVTFKGFLAAHKVAAIVVGVAVAGAIGGTALIASNMNKPNQPKNIVYNNLEIHNDVSEQNPVSEPQSEIEMVDVDGVLSDYLQSQLVASMGQASPDIAVHYAFGFEDALDSLEYSSMDGQGGVMGAKYLDIDNDDEDEMIVGLISYENGSGKINIQVYDYDDATKQVNEITGGKISSAYLGNTNITCQVAYQQKEDGFYIYITHVYTLTLTEGGYAVAGTFVWKLDDAGATQLVSEPVDFDSMGFYGYDTMKLANEQMPTIVQQWYDACPDDYGNTLFQKSIDDMNHTPLIEKLSEMDPAYQELIYYGMMRQRNSSDWIIDNSKPVLYGFYDFFE